MATKLDYKGGLKSFFKYAIGGILFFAIAGAVTGAYAGAVGFESTNAIGEFTNQIVTLQPMGILFGLGLFVILGALAMAFAIATVKIGSAVFGEPDVKIKFVKKRFLLPLAGVGIATFILLSVISQIATGISPDADLTNVMTLLDLLLTFNIGGVVASLVLFALTGFALVWVAKKEPLIEGVADKTRLNKI